MNKQSADVVVVGAGLAGLVTTLELAKAGKKVIVIDAQPETAIGGLANWAFGGMALVDTPEQRSKKINDSYELALSDWLKYANFSSEHIWPRRWAEHYIERCMPDVYDYLNDLNIKFLPAVNWAERSGNSVPRYHIMWGCSLNLIKKIKAKLDQYQHSIYFCFNERIETITQNNGRITGCISQRNEYIADNVVIATGGYGGDLAKVKQYWPKRWSPLAQQMLNGCHPSNDGKLAEHLTNYGAQLSQLSHMWNYAAGIRHPQPDFAHQGLSIIPCRSALWITPKGERIMPPIMGGNDTVELCHRVNELQVPYSWQILNRSIALRELAISGSEHNPAIRDSKMFSFLWDLIFGNRWLVNKMCSESDDFIVASSLDELANMMSEQMSDGLLDKHCFIESMQNYDELLSTNDVNDTQIANLNLIRKYFPDRLRTLKPRSIINNPPYIAINLRLISRKSMGGLLTNLNSQVLDANNNPIQSLYAVGETSGFGGGGSSGEKSIEGTFLSGCILTARQAARSLL